MLRQPVVNGSRPWCNRLLADLMQEMFLAAHQDFVQFHGNTEKELLSWLREVLLSNLANLVRRYRDT